VGKAREVSWSNWRPLAGLPPLSAATLAETLDGGQAFRWHRAPGGHWHGAWSDCVARVRLAADGRLEWSAPTPLASRVAGSLPTYFATARDFNALANSLPWRSDAHLAACLAAFPGLRLLRQPFGETLLGFLCSATKQIVQIKQMLALVAERHGAPLLPSPISPLPSPVCRLPTWPELAAVPEADFRSCLLGFRAKFISQTARFLAAHPGWLEETETLPYADAKVRLCSLPGVGEKIADCVLLFGAGRLEAFPVDTWILQTLARRYGLAGWRPAPLAQFGRAHFGPLAGLAQQYLFAYERAAA
jgi:N-glycosylase/DNA lyase